VATITVRNIDDDVQRRFKRRAADHGRSMKAEVRTILTTTLTQGGLAQAWAEATTPWRGDEIMLPERSEPRQVELGGSCSTPRAFRAAQSTA
jgi:antitoxin FitA